MLTTTQKTLVQESFATIAPIADDAASLFYRRLFELDPSLQGMFRGDMSEQRFVIDFGQQLPGGASAAVITGVRRHQQPRTMTPETIAQIRRSHEAIAATPRQLSARFYQELFTIAPELRRLFPGDLTSLQGHFEAALALVILNLDDMEALSDSLRDLGAQHVHWGARPEDYTTAREALIAAIRGLSADWTPLLKANWRAAITSIIVPMLQGAAVHTAVFAEQMAANGADV